MSTIYTITLNPAIDRLLYMEEEMVKRKTNRIEKVAYDIGGKGTHASYVISKFNVKNEALGFMGEVNAKRFVEILNSRNIEHDFSIVKGQVTRECYILLDDSAGSTMLTEKGLTLTPHDVEEFIKCVSEKVGPDDMVLIAGSLPVNFTISDLRKLIKTLKEARCFIACDVSGEALQLAVELSVDFIKPNEFELNELKRLNEHPLDTIKRLAINITYVIASLGAEGSYCAHNDQVYQVNPPKVNEVNDTGAGDCFVGAFLTGIYKRYPIEETLKFASGCAASKVMHHDSSTFSVKDAMELKKQVEINKILE